MMFHLRRPFLMGLALTVASVLARTQTTEAASKQILPGAVFALTNKTEGNEVIAFDRAPNGALTQTGRYATGGYGIGSDFDTQGGLVLSDDHHFLYACNPGSDNLTVFGVNGSHLTFLQKVAAGDEPLSITMSGKLLYVLDGSVAATQITGFTVADNGTLTPLPGSTKALSSPIAVPGEVLFSPDGRLLAVTHKVPGRFGPTLDTFQVDSDGLPGDPVPNQSFGMRPFAEAFRKDGRLFVVESGLPTVNNSGVSSYEVSEGTGLLAAITSAKNNQTDGCWIVIAENQKYAYTANFASGTISSFRLRPDGKVILLDGAAISQGLKSEPVDLALSSGSRFLYNLLRGPGGISGFRIEENGSLTALGLFGVGGGIPADYGASGLAAY
jgi:6-phosphogluconolactonase (cycloisomerase 2 family)